MLGVDLMDLCRGTQELEAVLGVELMDLCRGTRELEAVLGVENEVSCDPLARLRLAIQYGEKKVNYSPANCNSEKTVNTVVL